MSHQRHVSSFSAASRSSVFVQPDSKSGQLKVTPDAAILHLTYPYPLPLTALLDLIYTFRNNVLHETPRYLIMLTTLRLVVLGGFVGLSPRWRSRGGWVALVCGPTVGVAVWEGCAGQLKRHRDRSGDANPNLSISTTFLVVVSRAFLKVLKRGSCSAQTASIAVFEYVSSWQISVRCAS